MSSFLIQSNDSRSKTRILRRLLRMPADHNAVDSTLGYNFQTIFALMYVSRVTRDLSPLSGLGNCMSLPRTRSGCDEIVNTSRPQARPIYQDAVLEKLQVDGQHGSGASLSTGH
jgi:hypothetical protein